MISFIYTYYIFKYASTDHSLPSGQQASETTRTTWSGFVCEHMNNVCPKDRRMEHRVM